MCDLHQALINVHYNVTCSDPTDPNLRLCVSYYVVLFPEHCVKYMNLILSGHLSFEFYIDLKY